MTTQEQKQRLKDEARAEYEKKDQLVWEEYETKDHAAWIEYKKKLNEIEAME